MKTTEQIKSEVLTYLNKSAKHLFTIGNDEHKLLIEGDFFIVITGKNITYIRNIDNIIKNYNTNSKCVIKHNIFLEPRYWNRTLTSIKNYKLARDKYSKISEKIKGITDAEEIKKMIKVMIA